MSKETTKDNFRHCKMGVISPSIADLQNMACEYGINLDKEELKDFLNLINVGIESYRRVGSMPENRPEVKYPRSVGYQPALEENPLNAWYWKCSIKGEKEGKLAGKKIAIKDNVMVAGIPMMNGSAVLEGFVPDIDATIVTRILEEGGEIIGKATCEDLCYSGGSHTSATGPVLNPHNNDYSAGGSSSGSAALVANGDCDMSIGGDQGGSIRIPSCLCGTYGLKPSYGLVPYTGIFPLDNSIDHVGPIAASVEDVALLLQVIAGKDPLDPRQSSTTSPVTYVDKLTGDVKDLSFGIVKEGFGWPGSEDETDQMVFEAAQYYEKLGANVDEVSIPIHKDGVHTWSVICNDGAFQQVIRGYGFGSGWQGYYPTSAITYLGKSAKAKANEFPDTIKSMILLGHYMVNHYQNRFYARAQNQVPILREAYNKAFQNYDILIMPTTAPAAKAKQIPHEPTRADFLQACWEYHLNTCPFDLTGHPAMNVPCGKIGDLPVGMMLIGRSNEDVTVLRAAHAFQSLEQYK